MPVAGGTCCGGFGNPVGGTSTKINNKCSATPATFLADSGWLELEFSLNEPSQYSYKYTPGGDVVGAGAIANAYASGDLDCNNVLSTWTLQATAITAGSSIQGAATSLIPPPKGTF